MHNNIEVAFQKGKFNIISTINLKSIDRIYDIESSKEANEIAKNLKIKYEAQGVEFEWVNLW